jgi:hypothetical protein
MNPEVSKYLSDIGKLGGAAKSDAKAEAARQNGKRGGRPKKQAKENAK